MGASDPWKIAELDWFVANPDGGYADFLDAGWNRSKYAWWNKRSALIEQGVVPRFKGHGNKPADLLDLAPKDGAPDVRHNKPDVSHLGTDLLDLAIERQAQKPKTSTDFPEFFIETDRPLPILFIADWHYGSWGTNYQKIKETLAEIRALDLKIAVLGDMLQMAIKMRGMLEVSDNMMRPVEQYHFQRWFTETFHPHILWVTWDNHVVQRLEDAVGYADYAEMMKDKIVYSSGINHVDLMVGGMEFELYRIASSHRFRGRSKNPVSSQQTYMREEGIDREIAVAGDSHRPAAMSYYDGPLRRAAINVGSYQDESGYAKRNFSLFTKDDMPVVEFWPTTHHFHVYPDLDDYKKQLALR